MKIARQRYRKLPLAELEVHPRNPRRGNVAAIRESIEANDFVGAIIVQESTGYVLAGNHRLLAAREEGAETLPALVVDVDDETALRIMLADNRTSDLAEYADEELFEALRELGRASGSLEGSGWDYDDFRALERALQEDQAAAPAPARLGSMVLSFDDERLASFRQMTLELGSRWGSEVSDTVYECVERAVREEAA